MIRVAVAAPDRARCGVTDYARRLAAALPERIDISRISYPASDSASAWRRAAADAESADLVHVHYEYGLFGTVKPYRNRFATFMRHLYRPAVVSLHDLPPLLEPRWRSRPPYRLRDAVRDAAYLPFFANWNSSIYSLAKHWLVHTREHERVVARTAGGQRVTRWIHPIPEASERWIGASESSPRLVSPGFIKPHKGYSRLLDTLARLPGVSWTIAGGAQDERDQRYLERLSIEIGEQRLGGQVAISGYLPKKELEEVTAAASLAVFPFDRITGSGSVTWAIALGMPVVATDLDGVQELIEAGAGIDLLPLAEPDSWPDRIEQLATSPERLGALAAANREFAERHGYRHAGTRLAKIFEDILAR